MPDISIPLVGPSNEGIHPKADCQRSINLYPVKIEREGEKARHHLVGTPGTSLFATLLNAPVRGMYEFGGRLFVIDANSITEVLPSGATQAWGSIGTIRGRVSMCELGDDLIIGDGTGFYAWSRNTGLTTVITDAPSGRHCVAFNQRILYLEANSGRVYYSELNDATNIDPLNFFTAENQPDDALTIHATEDTVWIFGARTIEPWFNSGDADNPFERVPGGVIHAGVSAPDTVVRVDNSFFWVEADVHGEGIVRRSQGFSGVRVSTAAVERFTASATNLTGYSYQEQGHTFYVLNADEGTWVYDLKESEWHERAFLNQNTGELERARAEIHAFVFGKHIVSDYSTGQLYEQSLSFYTDNGTPLVARRITAHTDADGRAMTVDQLYIDMATGVGLITGQGSDPQAMLRYSIDGGRNWSNELHRDIGAIGVTNARVMFNSLGLGRDWVYEISISDPIPRVLIGAKARVRVGRR